MLTLDEAEQQELTKTLSDRSRFHSDGKAVTVAAVVLPLLAAPLVAVLVSQARSSWSVYGNPLPSFVQFFPRSLINTIYFPYFGIGALIIGSVAVIVYAIRTRGRHGVAVTSFGVVRVRGRKLTVLRYGEIDDVVFSERRRPRYRVITDEVEVKGRDGRTILLYGFGVHVVAELIRSNVSRVSSENR